MLNKYINKGAVMNIRDDEGLFKPLEDKKWEGVLISLEKNELNEVTYPRYDADLDEEFDAIRSIN